MPSPAIRCPACGDSSEIKSHGKRYAVYPAGCLYLIGLPFALLHQTSGPIDYECGKCGKTFAIRSLPARIALAMLIFLLILLLVVIVSLASRLAF